MVLIELMHEKMYLHKSFHILNQILIKSDKIFKNQPQELFLHVKFGKDIFKSGNFAII